MLNDFFVYVYLPLGLNIRKINGSGQAYLKTRDKSDASNVFSERPEKTISYDSKHPGKKKSRNTRASPGQSRGKQRYHQSYRSKEADITRLTTLISHRLFS
jgi:hypothetical protein